VAPAPGGFLASEGRPDWAAGAARKPDRGPRIVYASRTHTQVAQVVAELRSLPQYAPTAVTLASRSHYCIHKRVSTLRAGDLNNECSKLLSSDVGPKCQHYRAAEALAARVKGDVLDIEDLVAEGRDHGGCPYFAAKELATSADLVLCPYNYVVDPNVRLAMGLDLEGAVVIIDEAHNIEQTAMEAGSFGASLEALEDGARTLDDAATYSKQAGTFGPIARAFTGLCTFLRGEVARVSGSAAGGVGSRGKDWPVRKWPIGLAGLLEKLMELGFGEWQEFLAALELAGKGDDKGGRPRKRKAKGGGDPGGAEGEPPSAAFSVKGVELLGPCRLFLQCLSMVLGQGVEPGKGPSRAAVGGQVADIGFSLESNARHYYAAIQYDVGDRKWHFNLGCLWPGVVFRPLVASARCIVLASGTLSPLDSFEAELGAPFPFR